MEPDSAKQRRLTEQELQGSYVAVRWMEAEIIKAAFRLLLGVDWLRSYAEQVLKEGNGVP